MRTSSVVVPIEAPSTQPPLPSLDQASPVRIGGLGSLDSLVLSGPGADDGTESLAGHADRWGPLPGGDGPAVRALLRDGRLDGRGGGGFPLSRKVEMALLASGSPVLVVNASESEPASRKDRTLCRHRPHLVLDGAALLARALGVEEVVLHAHRSAESSAGPLSLAIIDRVRAGLEDPLWRLAEGPDRYVAGESSAVASFIDGGEARPHFTSVPLASAGPSGRPTVVANVETVTQLAVAARIGAHRWNSLGAPSSPGPRLVTLSGAVPHPGQVLELIGPGTIGDLLAAGGIGEPPVAVLVGGFAGTWVRGAEAWQTPFNRQSLACIGAAPGCGLLGVLPHGACGLRETARIVRYLAGESAGQCGSCVSGLPLLADAMDSLAEGAGRRRTLRRMSILADDVFGSGACAHPDGVVLLVRSTLEVFGDDMVRHLAGGPCRGADHPPVLPVPATRSPSAEDGGDPWR
jgi:NADH:ubiquinone oxidoreductase subunit F (NADH-binding)